MAILNSCCLWQSVRKGSFATGIYSFIYFGSSCIIVSSFLHSERRYLSGEVDNPIGESFLEKETISSTTVIFNILLLFCAACGVVASILVIIGLKIDRREFLLPWILVMLGDILVECSHFVYLIVLETLDFEPLTATLFTIDFFIMCLNIYCLLCVISQYQEYKAGRGGARHNSLCQMNNIQYIPPSTTICGGGTYHQQREINLTSPILQCSHTNCTVIPEENQLNGSYSTIHKSQFNRHSSKLMKKHVKFPDEYNKCCPSSDTHSNIYCSNDANGNGQTMAINTQSEINYHNEWTEHNDSSLHGTENLFDDTRQHKNISN